MEWLYGEDRFMQGTLTLRDRRLGPELVTAPVLNVAETRSPVAPPESILPFHDALTNDDKTILWYEADKGVSLQHVGMLVGKTAHQALWPDIIRWLRSHRP